MATESDRHILTSIFNPFLPLGENTNELDDGLEMKDGDDDTEETKLAKEFEVRGVRCAEQGKVEESLELFAKAIEVAPKRASGYNNRAQALRIKGDISGAERDLECAIRLSRDVGRVASQAYCQRGAIRQLGGEKGSALEDFEKAAKLGNEFARTMSVQLNPYAALCNQMLSQAMAKLQTGEQLN